MRRVTVIYHYEDGSWWADSPDKGLETFVAGGESLDQTRKLAREGAEFHLGERIALVELYDPQHVVTRLDMDKSPLPVVVYGGPASSESPRAKVTITPAQPRPVSR
jgi:predicted RNase H-like HicB family nuclease